MPRVRIKGSTPHAAGITVTAPALIEGVRSNPTWATMRKIAAGLGTTVGAVADLADRLADDEQPADGVT